MPGIRKIISRLRGGTTMYDEDGNVIASGKTYTDAHEQYTDFNPELPRRIAEQIADIEETNPDMKNKHGHLRLD